MSPAARPPLLEALRQRAAERPQRIVLPEVDDPRTYDARRVLESEGLAEIVWIEDPGTDSRRDLVVEHIYRRRQTKGISRDEAAALALQPLYFAATLVALEEADGCVAGAVHTTADVIRAGLHCVGTSKDTPAVSSMFLLVRGEEVLSYADCGVIPDPTPEQHVAIARATARNHKLLTGDAPCVAFLSFSTKGSAAHETVSRVQTGLRAFQHAHPEIPSDGELQFDAALLPEVAAQKAPHSTVAGHANVFVFPDLNSGNIAYKITERLAGFSAFGPLIQGLARPCLDLSRGCSAEDITQVAVIAAVMAQE